MAKDLFDLFRENEDKLTQTPSPKTWSRIERRIQSPGLLAKRRKVRVASFSTGMAAALALVIGLMVVFMWLIDRKDHQHAIAQIQTPLETEELIISTNHQKVERVAMVAQDQYVKPLKSINEGRPEQKLMATVDKSAPKSTPSNAHTDSIRREKMSR